MEEFWFAIPVIFFSLPLETNRVPNASNLRGDSLPAPDSERHFRPVMEFPARNEGWLNEHEMDDESDGADVGVLHDGMHDRKFRCIGKSNPTPE